MLLLPHGRRAPRTSRRCSPRALCRNRSRSTVRAQSQGESRLGPSQIGPAPAKPRHPLGARTLGGSGRAGESGPWVHTPAGIRCRGPGTRARCVGEEQTFRAGGGRARGPVAALRITSRVLLGSPDPDPRPPVASRPAQVASQPRQPIPRAEAPHWLRSFISRGARLVPLGRPMSAAGRFSAP